jgi:cytochrome oxidase Cu insertion factor (SCO1/SenC/PrrC family)
MTLALTLLLALFQAPTPGTYELPPIAQVRDRELVDPSGARVSFPGLAAGQVSVVAFIYRGCHDAQGCPASLALLRELDQRLAADPARAARVRLACVSFDPADDTPARMAELRDLMAPRSDWRFLVPDGPESLSQLLRDFGQDVVDLPNGAKRHVMKVYLVDAQDRVRNVYSSGFLDADLVLADIDTVAPPSAK